jgi:hypothetical protein
LDGIGAVETNRRPTTVVLANGRALINARWGSNGKEAMLPDQDITFHLSPDEKQQLEKDVDARPRPLVFMSALMLILNFGTLGLRFARLRDPLLTVAYVALLIGYIALTVVLTRPRRQRMPATGTLRLSATGLTGTVEAKPVTIRWCDIEAVSDVDDAIVVLRRRNLQPVALPKRNITDARAFWTFLEEALVAKRGLIRSQPPRTRILNSAY